MGFSFANIVEFPKGYLAIEVEIVDILPPVIDGNAMHLIGLEDHDLFLLHLDHHGNMVEITICKHPLQFGSEVFSVEEKYVASLRLIKKLSFSERVLMLVHKFIHRLQHKFVLFAVILQHLLDGIPPFLFICLIFGFQKHVLALSSEVKHESLRNVLKFCREYLQVDAADNLFFLFIFETVQFFRREYNVAGLSK